METTTQMMVDEMKEQILLIESDIDKTTAVSKKRCRSAATKIKKLATEFKRNHK